MPTRRTAPAHSRSRHTYSSWRCPRRWRGSRLPADRIVAVGHRVERVDPDAGNRPTGLNAAIGLVLGQPEEVLHLPRGVVLPVAMRGLDRIAAVDLAV
jgi:hypothetical protein